MRFTLLHIISAFLAGCIVTYVVLTHYKKIEGFDSGTTPPVCSQCGDSWPCSDHNSPSGMGMPMCPPMPDMSKYVLKSSIPPCSSMPDLKNYMLKTECPPAPDLSQYVLKASIPPPQPIIVDTSEGSCGKGAAGECPPCPRPRCPQITCPPPTVCPACPPCPRATCPQTVVKCKAEETESSPVRPFLAPLSGMFGSA